MAKTGSSLTINLKLGIVFAALLAIFLGFGTFVIARMADMNSRSDEIRTNWLPSVRVVDDITLSATEFRVIQVRHILSTDQAAMRVVEKELEDKLAQLQKLRRDYEPMIDSEAERTIYRNFEQNWQAFMAAHEELLELSRRNENDKALALYQGRAKQMFDAASKNLHDSSDLNYKSALNEANASETAYLTSRLYIWIAMGFVTAMIIGAIILVMLMVSRRLRALEARMSSMAQKDYEASVPYTDAGDEIGSMARTLLIFRDGLKEAERLTQAQIETDRRTAEQTRQQMERERQAAAEIATLVDAVAKGDVSRRLSTDGKDGVFLSMSEGINRLTAAIETVMTQVGGVLSAMSNGDMSKRISGNFEGIFGRMRDDANKMGETLGGIATRLTETANEVNNAASEISAGSQDLAQRTESQAASIEETAASMHEITTTVRQNADNAMAANQLASAARDSAEKGGGITQQAIEAMGRIEQSAGKISDIVSLIDEIAFQTNLLALNASVEAARAGEAGKGFAVVAQEVRALAQRSANASKDIKALINESNAQVKSGATLVNQTGGSLMEIVTAIKKVSDIMAEIAAASQQQSTGLDQVNTAVGQMDELTQRNGALVEETSASAQSLAGQAQELNNLVRFFKI
ncbi:methyl-accepting chemotaxis protein [Ferrovibrio sp.]|uniref:HAMP domain-containing methyl-accepting chemotaxis protein n=1 Tax=Ferrovibrio sp. TaxID=1917215 RepID=UPI0025BD9AD9|nr:methyl-accepting chemotaxis protein [Ferrovibrio sp.]MBX3455924.1 MCP four helix bundle domain-containing protein [Ferrovibrio sp.]